MMTPETRLARLAVRNPLWTALIAALLAAACVAVIALRARLDSDILNLLPQRFDSVRGLKVFDREFSQAHELTFALWDEKGESNLDGFAEHFGEMLRKEPWVIRVMDRVPMESAEGIAEVQTLAVPLLLNLPPGDFAKAVENLEPRVLAERLHRKRAEIEAGSIKAEMELNFDPTGLVVAALKPLANSFSMDGGGTRPLASPDGTLRVAVAVTRQEKLDANSCQAMMRTVEDFKARVLASWKEKEGEGQGGAPEAPEILVTGRTPYVAEMSLGMKGDIISTVVGSVVLVGGVFYLGFRRFRPLIAILHVLLLCCLVAVAAGTVLFGSLNVVTMGICAIMVGIGVDFGMLFYGTYQVAREEGETHEEAATRAVNLLGRGVLFGAATAAASFSSLLLSESPGFAQLGLLIGVGVLTAAFLMMTVFFALLGRTHRPGKRDFLSGATLWYMERLHGAAKPVAIGGVTLLIALNLFAYLPVGKVRMEVNPKALEPADSRAGFALRKITEKLPAAEVEPVLAIIQGKDAADFQAQWAKAQARWLEAKEKGEIRNFTAPAGFAVAPDRLKQNLAQLKGRDFAPARAAFSESLDREGFDAGSFRGAFGLIDALQTLSTGDLSPAEWRRALPEASAWIFVLDRFLSETPNVGLAYITPNKTVSSAQEQEQLRAALETPGVEAIFTGWSYVMADLVPWSKTKLTMLSVVMVLFITTVLVFLYRAFAPLAVLLLSLALSIGAMIACLKLTGLSLNLFNVLAFPLCLGVGVDYGIYTILGVRQRGGPKPLATVIKPVILSGLTTIAGFGSLGFATHPALATLGLVCATGVACCLLSTLIFILPIYLWRGYR